MRKWLLLLGLLIGLLPLSAMAQTEDAPTLTPGSLITGTLNADNYVDAYIFAGSVGDLVSLSATTEDELALVLLVTGPEGGIVAQAGDPASPSEAIISNLELAASGTYTVTVLRGSGMTGTETGSYSLILTGRLTPPAAGGTAEATPATTQQTPAPAATEEPGATEPATDGQTFEVQNITLEAGGISIGLGWSEAIDLNLEVRDPLGGSLFYNNATVPSGGSFSGDVNADCETARATNPTEAATWPASTLPAGSYEILVYYINGCEINTPQEFNIIATLNNESPQVIRGTLNPGQQYVARVDLETDATWSLVNGGVYTDANVAPLSNQIAAAEALTGNTVTDVITNEQPAVAYTFQADAGTTVNFNLNRTSGSLDAFLLLLDEQGRLLASNDDDVNIATTNSAISFNVTAAGTYTVVATRFGQTIGGTEGGFQLIRAVTQTVATAPTATPAGSTVVNTPAPVPTLAPTASTLTQSLPPGTVEVSLRWQTQADLQLLVRDPTGAVVYDDTPPLTPGGLPTSPTGGILAEAGNVGCTGTARLPALSYVYWPQGRIAPRGVYEVELWYQNNCNDNTPVTAELRVEVDGQEIINTQVPMALDQHYMITFNLAEGSTEAFEGGYFDMDSAASINYFDRLATATAVNYGNSVSGSITNVDRIVVYSFRANVGDVVQVSMERTGGTLDPVLYLLAEGGIQIAFNDDTPNQPPGGTRDTDSLLTAEIRAAGTYYIIATHYGQEFGGTTGTFRLTILETP